jgi:hypothetical protein
MPGRRWKLAVAGKRSTRGTKTAMLMMVTTRTEPRLPVRLPSTAFNTLWTVINAPAATPPAKNPRNLPVISEYLPCRSPRWAAVP